MRRVIYIWLPTWPTDRLRRSGGHAAPETAALVVSGHDGRRRIVTSVDRTAAALGIAAGMPLAHAQAMAPDLTIVATDPEADAAALGVAAAWCLRFAPLTAPVAPDGIFVDATGSTHLHGGETALLEQIVRLFALGGIAARAAIADTPGAALAVARYGGHPTQAVPPGDGLTAIGALPVAALRLNADIVAALRRVGFDTIAQLAAAPRAPLARRFGRQSLLRLDQALGRVFEPIAPVFPPATVTARLNFVEPLSTADALAIAIDQLAVAVCDDLGKAGRGARQLDLAFERVDATLHVVRIGTARPTRDAPHLGRLLRERLDTVDPGAGIEAMRLVVSLAEPIVHEQSPAMLADDDVAAADVSMLVDRLENRLGRARVYRATPVESRVPERSVARMPALTAYTGRTWPLRQPRPSRLLDPPQPVDAMALLPDQPPVAFTWRRVRHRIRRADGPERITGEWWRRDGETWAVRDYFHVEDEAGRRFWLYRSGDGVDPATGTLDWFLHGLF